MNGQNRRALAVMLSLMLGIACGFAILAATASAADERAGAQPASPQMWDGCFHIVRRGETLFSIGMRYGVSPYYLAQMNGLWNPNIIYAGMRLLVPCGGYSPKLPPPKSRCQPAATYVVRPGDNLFRIALNYGTTVNALRDANNLWGHVLRSGMSLTIPCPGTVSYGTRTPPPDEVPEKTVMPAQVTPGTVPEATPTFGPPPSGATATLPPEPSAQVTIGQAVDPATVNIKGGQSIVFINNTQSSATILSGFPGQPNGLFTSGVLPPGGTWVYVFDTVGSYSFYVMENPTLVGQVIVTP